MQGLPVAWKRQRWMLVLLMLFGITTLSQAAYEGRTFIVDPQAPESENSDGDFHFNTLKAALDPEHTPHIKQNDLVILKPGTYRETVDINVPGVTVRSQQGQGQTFWVGGLSISAKQVWLEGINVDATGHAYGIAVQARQATIKDVGVSGAEQAGIWLDQAPFATLQRVQIHNNLNFGLLAIAGDEVVITQSRFQANGAAGAKLGRLKNVSLTHNEFSLNGTAGLQFEDNALGRVLENRFTGNAQHGFFMVGSANIEIFHNAFEGNGEFGLVLDGSVQTTVSHNVFADNGGGDRPSGGLRLQNSSLENRIEANTFSGHSDVNGSGVQLLGDTSANQIRDNTFAGNQTGIRMDHDELGRPQINLIANNRIEGSQGPGIYSEGKNNRMTENMILGNNGPGIQLVRSEGEWLAHNTIMGNGKPGVYVEDSRQLKLLHNEIGENAGGILAKQLSDSEFQGNLVQNNHGKGIRITGGTALKLLQNTVRANREDGLWLEDTEQVTLSENLFGENGAVGSQLEDTVNTEVYDNRFANNAGGLAVWGGKRITVQFNDFDHNGEFGLWTMDEAGLDARYNFWGSGAGPSGLSPTREFENDLVKEVDLKTVFPWLSRPAADVVQPSVKGWFFKRNPEVMLRHAPQAGISFNLTGLEATNGWLSVSVPKNRPDNAPPLGEELNMLEIFAGGQIEGNIELIVPYDPETLPERAPESELRLFLWDGTAWQELNSTVDVQRHTLSSRISARALQEVTLALAWPQRRALTRAAWVLSQSTWIVGEPLNVRLSDPDKDLDPTRLDRLAGAIQVLDDQGAVVLTLDAIETEPASGIFEPQWTQAILSDSVYRLRYVDPEAAEDRCETTLHVIARRPFVVDPSLPRSEDENYDFRFKTFAALFSGQPSVQAGETIHLLPGRYAGDWQIDVPGVRVVAEPGAVLQGSLTLSADGITLTGFDVHSDAEVAVDVQGDHVTLQNMTIVGKHTALRVKGRSFSLQNTRVEGQTGIELQGDNANIIRNAIIGAPALISGSALSVERNWWGSVNGPKENVQGVTQENIFPWLLTPPVGSLDSTHVEGATWEQHSVLEILGEMGQALLALDFPNLWLKLYQLFGQGGSNFAVSPSWSLHVNPSRSGRFIFSRDAHELPTWMPKNTQRFGLWLDPAPNTTLTLFHQGVVKPQIWLKQENLWVELRAVPAGQDRWRVRLPRLSGKTLLPLWVAVAHP